MPAGAVDLHGNPGRAPECIDDEPAAGRAHLGVPLRLRHAGHAQQVTQQRLTGRAGARDNRLECVIEQPTSSERGRPSLGEELADRDEPPLNRVRDKRSDVVSDPAGQRDVDDGTGGRGTPDPTDPLSGFQPGALMDDHESHRTPVTTVRDSDVDEFLVDPQTVQDSGAAVAEHRGLAAVCQGGSPPLTLRKWTAVIDHHTGQHQLPAFGAQRGRQAAPGQPARQQVLSARDAVGSVEAVAPQHRRIVPGNKPGRSRYPQPMIVRPDCAETVHSSLTIMKGEASGAVLMHGSLDIDDPRRQFGELRAARADQFVVEVVAQETMREPQAQVRRSRSAHRRRCGQRRTARSADATRYARLSIHQLPQERFQPFGHRRRTPHVVVTDSPGARCRTPSPVRKALGGQVIGSVPSPRRRRCGLSVSAVKISTNG